ncbi:hypothetical protein CC86DRAFT_457598 [Ophiobolus disseminans]|uniref:F-box domain-containing protein n=1 Tax=Ophiobolus disseminans TaxID=1469910 RepID=A0A6A6ZSJ8_9PLEO|nr:hypothetical protein CC86DRAFT_457598 [Ophiobolus disseminans]
MDHLSSLPAELIDNVCGHLPRKYDVQQLRLTSRQLCRSSQHAFDDRHFKVIRCMNTRDSLERLLDFVRNERVCKAVRELEIFPFLLMSKSAPRRFSVEPCTEGEKTKFANIHQVISDDPSQIHTQLSIQGQPGQSGPHPKYMEYDRMLRQRRRESYHKQRRDQAALVASGLDVKLLAKALRTLPALKSIKVVDRTEGDIDLPFGAMQFRRETGTPRPTTLNYTASEYLYLQLGAYTVSLILGALLQSNTDLEILAFCKMPYRPAEARDARSRKSSLTAAGSLKQRQMVDLKLSDIHNFALETWSFQYTLCSTYATDTATTWFVPLISRLISRHRRRLSPPSGAYWLFGSTPVTFTGDIGP